MKRTNRNLILTSLLGGLTILLGAFGAHTIKDLVTETALQSFETAVRYQFYHVLALLIINSIPLVSDKHTNTISYFFFAGILFFSGSIYLLTLGIPATYIWFVTPFGGVLFLLGWLYLAYSFSKSDCIKK
ncbi:MAG: DUF423 domain-containing protein [Lutibacter sp.]|jgi:uncharacterized membrane protein YgdD (TMEM256/DUF423 family)|nr:DUF423 domain-containing protein [Lutibacter sp.]